MMRLAALTLACLALEAAGPPLESYNVVWTSQSRNAGESMPVGGSGVGANVWVENGELLLYVQSSGTFDENNEFLKQGRFRIRMEPNPFAPGEPFRQEVKLRQGSVEITGGFGTVVRVWVESARPVLHVDIAAGKPVAAYAQYESWRTEDREVPDNGARHGCFGWDAYPGKVVTFRDEIGRDGNAVTWVHRNRDDRLIFEHEVKQQDLGRIAASLWNPLRGRTFGGALSGEGFVPDGEAQGRYLLNDFHAWKLRSAKPAASHSLSVYLHTRQTRTLEEWRGGLRQLMTARTPTRAAAWRSHLEWWRQWWIRGYVSLQTTNRGGAQDPVWQMGRNYQLFRYMLGANVAGELPTKFNGGLFTVDPHLTDPRRAFGPDFRAWGGGSFTGQNQRLVYWPMLRNGDFDAMLPQFDFYRRALANATALVKEYWGHGGARFTEQMNFYGLPIAATYGWAGSQRRPRPEGMERGLLVNKSVGEHFETQLEIAQMILAYRAYSGRDIAVYLPFIEESLRFYDEHYQFLAKQRTGQPLDARGRLILYPSQALETYANATNPVSVIAGLKAVLEGLLQLPASPAKQAGWRAMLARLPDLPVREKDGVRVMDPADSYTGPQNVELPQFYPLFPFDLTRLGQPEMNVYINTWKRTKWTPGQLSPVSWHQNGIFLARMGLTDEAAAYALKKMTDSGRRFPAFWGPGHDWVPDHNWGGSGMINIQEMLLQSFGREILLLPAWPQDWDADFKLQAPLQTTIECTYRAGRLVRLEVTPPDRRRDVMLPPWLRP